ncbi:MAG: hypothetical protein HC771_16140 [Synechococcales cyanobacterium CRU_2_2]|nr:hypothetical protein [Synechococcales cyanobacterium CRU_2_2]
MPRPSTDLDVDPEIARLASYLQEWLNNAVAGEILVGETIIVDAFVAYLETDANFPLLQVTRGDHRGSGRIDTLQINIEYFLPSGLDLILTRPGWLRVVSEEIQKAIENLQYHSVLSKCKT